MTFFNLISITIQTTLLLDAHGKYCFVIFIKMFVNIDNEQLLTPNSLSILVIDKLNDQ